MTRARDIADAGTKVNYLDNVTANIPADVATTFAPLAGPTFTGTPIVPTASATTNTTQAASTAFVRTEVSNLVDSAPGSLDTLNELAAALGDDAAFSTTVTNSIAAKLPLAGGTMSGNIVMGDDTSIGIADDAERIEFDGAGDISVLGADFGLGATPAYKLAVQSTVSADEVVANFENDINAIGEHALIRCGHGSLAAYMGQYLVTDDLAYFGGDADPANLKGIYISNSTGQVGIGITSPATAIHANTSFKGALKVGIGTRTPTGSGAYGHVFADVGTVTGDNSAKVLKQSTSADGSLYLVTGNYSTVRFVDLVLYLGSGGIQVLGAQGVNGPGTRTYTRSSETIKIAIDQGSAVFNVGYTALGGNEIGYAVTPTAIGT